MNANLRLGPLLRHVDETTATIWVETSAACRVTVVAGDVYGSADTFAVHGHHYALCELAGLRPGTATPYRVYLDDSPVWPEPGGHPPSIVRTPDGGDAARIAFGSCHTAADHSPRAIASYGVDMLRSYALRLAERRAARPEAADHAIEGVEPTVLLLIGDQVYADELQPAMLEFLRERRSQERAHGAAEPPDDEVVFFDEYAELYRQAWSDPDIRWLLSTVPTLMLFDDHDIRDDWNTSGTWRREIARYPWWRPRITSGLGAYWVYQHLGNLSPEARATDPVFTAVTAAHGDAGEIIDDFAWRAHNEPTNYHWSYRYDVGDSRLVMIDNRCGRVVDDDADRAMLGPDDRAWLDEQLTGDVSHLVLVSTLPFLLPPGVHYLEAWNEAVCAGAWGGPAARVGEKLRQEIDLEHWAAFQRSFYEVSETVLRVAAGQRGRPPASVLFLGGDVHFSYLAHAEARRSEPDTGDCAIVQLVCSPTRNWMQPLMRRLMWLAARGVSHVSARLLALLAGISPAPLRWRITDGPWYDNTLATLTLEGRSADVRWEHSPALNRLAARLTGEAKALGRPKIRELTHHRLTP